MTEKTYKGSGGLWLKEGFRASDTAPRWSGKYTCSACGFQDSIVGYGRDQQRTDNSRAPTIQLRVNRDG